MAFWLFKVEPDCYSYADLARDKKTNWDGVSNAAAQKHLRAVAKGDRVFLYHTGDEKSVVGVMEVTVGPTIDPADEAGKKVYVTVKPVRKLATPVALATIKADPAFAGWDLVRLPRLSVMPVTAEQWARVEELGGEG
ncbi:EVE domain-containing protein [Urbifossiella limnaea]|uniref:EVE domain protein n=1 Tax=Urbifossiella limnaea TaxID=2528023 RepID=A0A517XRJ8_9BACT|nr:EVE domain-containing protein [Urbifossiella limnaea]QDU20103.1 EVE domain protein [Urbifossiella limnaea]